MRMKLNKKFIPPICVLLIIAIVLGFVLKDNSIRKVSEYNYAEKKQTGESLDSAYNALLTSDGVDFLFNEKTGGIAFEDGSTGVSFMSSSESAAESNLGAVLNLSLRDENGNKYILNSRANSSTFGKFEITAKEADTVQITYRFYKDESGVKKNEVLCEIPLNISVCENGFEAKLYTEDCKVKDGMYVEEISILSGLFSQRDVLNNSFYTVPDGCGAQIDLNSVTAEDYSAVLPVYGSDPVFDEHIDGAYLPCFAFTKGSLMATVIIGEGDGISEISLNRFKSFGGDLYNTFTLTSCGFIDGIFFSGNTYSGEISQKYIFTRENNNYNTVSNLVRDSLADMGYIPESFGTKFADMPFFVSVIADNDGDKRDIYSTFENASEIVALLKSKGVRSVALRLVGGTKGGFFSGANGVGSLNELLGTEEDYNELCSVAVQNNSSVWLDVNLSATPYSGSTGGTDIYSEATKALGFESRKYNFQNKNYLNSISSVYKLVSKFENTNLCLNDLSFVLYTDFKNDQNRQELLNDLKEKVTSLGVGGGLLLTRPAVYLMKGADGVLNMPQSAVCADLNGVTVVPLLQMVLHGSVLYGTENIDLSEDSTDAVLKAVEYGASPSFMFTYDGVQNLDYGLYASVVAKHYSTAKRMMPLMDMQITSHEKVVSNVYKITYDYSKVVYVNYNPSVVEVNGILIDAKDFVII